MGVTLSADSPTQYLGGGEIMAHFGHPIEVEITGDPLNPDAVTLLCTTCLEVLIEWSWPLADQQEEIQAALEEYLMENL